MRNVKAPGNNKLIILAGLFENNLFRKFVLIDRYHCTPLLTKNNFLPKANISKFNEFFFVPKFQYIVPFMVATMASKWIADALGKEGIYDGHIALNEYPYLDIKQDLNEQKTLVNSVMNPKTGNLTTLPLQVFR